MFFSLAFCILLQTCTPPPAPIRVVGVGDTSEQARDNAYRDAMETYMGAVVVSDKEMRDFQLVKDSVLVYSSAYVERMRIISDTPQGNKRRVELDVWLSSSKIANRILTIYSKEQHIDSGQVSEQVRTYLRSKGNGDKLLETVLDIYPYNAFVLDQQPIEVKLDPYRVPYLRVPYTVKWNKNYVIALEETAKAIGDSRKNAVSYMAIGGGSSWFIKPYYFNDHIPVTMMLNRFNARKVAVRLSLTNGNQTVYSTCQSVFPNYFHGPGQSNLDIAGDKNYNGEFNIKLPVRLDPNIKTSISVDSEDRC